MCCSRRRLVFKGCRRHLSRHVFAEQASSDWRPSAYNEMGDLSFKSDPLIIGWAVYGFAVNCDSMTANGSDAGFKYPVGVEEGVSIP